MVHVAIAFAEVDFFRDEGVPLELMRVDNPGRLFRR